MGRFGDGIRAAATLYAEQAKEPTVNELYIEIASLHRAAGRRAYDRLAILLERLSPKARNLLNGRAARPSIGTKLPPPEALRDDVKREAACELVEMLCCTGGHYIEGRRRPSGKRSRTWRPRLYAPEPRRHVPRREAERGFVMWLRMAWLEATGVRPTMTANHSNPGPFARMVGECLRLVGAPYADAIGLINQLDRLRDRLNTDGVSGEDDEPPLT